MIQPTIKFGDESIQALEQITNRTTFWRSTCNGCLHWTFRAIQYRTLFPKNIIKDWHTPLFGDYGRMEKIPIFYKAYKIYYFQNLGCSCTIYMVNSIHSLSDSLTRRIQSIFSTCADRFQNFMLSFWWKNQKLRVPTVRYRTYAKNPFSNSLLRPSYSGN
jgi:hypothetical protein